MNISEFVSQKMKEQERNLSWLADKLDVSYPTLYSRFKSDKLHAHDLVRAAKVLHFDLNELKQIK